MAAEVGDLEIKDMGIGGLRNRCPALLVIAGTVIIFPVVIAILFSGGAELHRGRSQREVIASDDAAVHLNKAVLGYSSLMIFGAIVCRGHCRTAPGYGIRHPDQRQQDCKSG